MSEVIIGERGLPTVPQDRAASGEPNRQTDADASDAGAAGTDEVAAHDLIARLQRQNRALVQDHAERLADILALTRHRSQELETLRTQVRDARMATEAAKTLRAEKADLEKTVSALHAQVAALEGARAAAEERLSAFMAEVHASTSWRLTAPLRGGKLLLRRLWSR